jgi:hypothetical protein
MNFIKSYCHIIQGLVVHNGEKYFKTKCDPFVMKDFFNACYQHTGIDYRKFYKMDDLSKLGFLASEILLAGSDREQAKPDMGILFFNRSSSLRADINYQKTIQDKDNCFPSPADFVYTLPNIVTGEIAIRNKIYGETVFLTQSNLCTDSICDLVGDMMCYGGMNYVLTGWLEADAFANRLECFMMLCTSEKGKATIEKSESYLPKKPDDLYHDRYQGLSKFPMNKLYFDLKDECDVEKLYNIVHNNSNK